MKKLIVKLVGNYINVLSYFSKSKAANKAMHLFMTPRAGKISEEQSSFLDTAQQEELHHETYPIMTYRWIGSKQTILLAHGWESNSARWKNLITTLKNKGYDMIALDAPAHGQSGSDVFNAILYAEFINVAAQRFSPDILIGHSVGGMACALFQSKYQPVKLKKMILLGSPSEFKDVMKRYTDMLSYNKRVISELNRTIETRFGNSADTFSTAKFLESSASEGLLIHDKNDRIIPYNDALLINNSFKNSQLITTKGLGHSLNHPSVTEHIYTFINS
ncbi:MAG TPA: alpha/beta hydrolase [Gelidibacter sp.]|uniref:alpha/beta fold hydrolase n=1 Tax=Gelidibacter sp. TaxID=2018083 RepID=UPI002C7979DD|nr:alpha/beta hydrolase [Gelidibacter sp.]HXJ99290.1 alpha/beta hydrolase [Gelidibacter sp.]